MLKRISFLKFFIFLIIVVCMQGCAPVIDKESFSYLKGRNVSVITYALERRADIIEDWHDYKRYTWRICKTVGLTEMDIRDVRNEDAFYIKPEVDCCDIAFETNVFDIILDYHYLESCPVPVNFKDI